MILEKTGQPVTTSEDFVEKSFGIKDEDKGLLLEILRSKMYTNPIGSVCREIASNSRDANREVGNADPIRIIFSDSSFFSNESTIVFQDEGPGISPDRMDNVFINYGSSTKRHSNQLTGGFGLGCKTPFSYTDSFCVITIVDGFQYTYIAAVEEQTEGKIYLVNKIESKEKNGTSIIVPYKEEDRSTFEEEVYKATYFWSTRPTYVNFNKTIESLSVEVIEETPSFILSRQNFFGGRYGLVIDGVLYPIDGSILSFANTQLAYGLFIVLKFNTGDLTISATRETVQYDEKTKTCILDQWNFFMCHLRTKLTDEVKKCKNLLEACVTYYEISKNEKNPLFLINNLIQTFNKSCGNTDVFNSTEFADKISYRLDTKNLEFTFVNDKGKTNKYYLDEDFLRKPIYICDKNFPTSARNKTLHVDHPLGFILIKPNNNKVFRFTRITYKEKRSLAKELRACLSQYKEYVKMGMKIRRYSEVPITKTKRAPKVLGQPLPSKAKSFLCRRISVESLSTIRSNCEPLIVKDGQISLNQEIISNMPDTYLYYVSSFLSDPDALYENNVLIHQAHVLGHIPCKTILYIHEKNEHYLKGVFQSVKDKIPTLPQTLNETVVECYVTNQEFNHYDLLSELNFKHVESSNTVEELRKLKKLYRHVHLRDYRIKDLVEKSRETHPIFKLENKMRDIIKKYPFLGYFVGPNRMNKHRESSYDRTTTQNYVDTLEENFALKGIL